MHPSELLLSNLFILGVTRIEELGRAYREPEPAGVAWMQLLWLLVPALAIFASVIVYRLYERAARSLIEADGLLDELFVAHQFPPAARQLCCKIADTCDLSDPAVMMVSPMLFEGAVRKASQSMTFGRQQRETLDWIRKRLFASE